RSSEYGSHCGTDGNKVGRKRATRRVEPGMRRGQRHRSGWPFRTAKDDASSQQYRSTAAKKHRKLHHCTDNAQCKKNPMHGNFGCQDSGHNRNNGVKEEERTANETKLRGIQPQISHCIGRSEERRGGKEGSTE